MKCFNCQHECSDKSKFCESCGALLKKADEGGRKVISIFFSDMVGSTALTEGLGAEEARAKMEPVLQAMIQSVHKYGGTVIKAAGDGIMALFGAPTAYEDHAQRACYAALQLQKRVADFPNISVRVGINSGEVVVDLIGTDTRREYDAMGPAVAIAARMEQTANKGTIQISPDTYSIVMDQFEIKSLGKKEIKGISKPMDTYELHGVRRSFTRFAQLKASRLSYFIGRDKEMTTLDASLKRAIAGEGQMIGIAGEPGEGKSRLVYEFMNNSAAKDVTQYVCQCQSALRTNSYLAVKQILENALGISEQSNEEKEIIVREAFKSDNSDLVNVSFTILGLPNTDAMWNASPPELKKAKIKECFTKIVLDLCAHEPIILLAEDLQWMDAESLECMNNLIEKIKDKRILILLTFRREFNTQQLTQFNYKQLDISPLKESDFMTLATSILGNDASLIELKKWLVQKCKGNPFFLEESVQSLKDHQNIEGEPGNYKLLHPIEKINLPNTIQAVLESRIDKLEQKARQTVRICSVIGKTISVDLLKTVIDFNEDDLNNALNVLSTKNFISKTQEYPDIIYTFNHDIILESIYQSLLKGQKKTIHTNLLKSLEENFPLVNSDIKANHAFRAEIWDKAFNYYFKLQMDAHARSSPVEALTFYNKMKESYDKIAEPVREQSLNYLHSITHVYHTYIWLDKANEMINLITLGKKVLEKLQDPLAEIEFHATVLWVAYLGSGMYAESVQVVEEGMALIEKYEKSTGQKLELLKTLMYWGLYHAQYFVSDYRKCIDSASITLERISDPKMSEELSGAPLWSVCHLLKIAAATKIGDFEEAQKSERAILEIIQREPPSASNYINLSTLVYYYCHHKQFEEALKYINLNLELSHRLNVSHHATMTYGIQGYIFSLQNKMKEAEVALNHSYTLAANHNFCFYNSRCMNYLCQGYINLGRIDRAKEIIEKMFEFNDKRKQKSMEAYGWKYKAEVEALEKHLPSETVIAHYKKAIDAATKLEMIPEVAKCQHRLAQYYADIGQQEQSQEHEKIAIELFSELGIPEENIV